MQLKIKAIRNIISIFIFLIFVQFVFGQDSIVIKKRIIGTFHTRNTEINGLSFGAVSSLDDYRNVKTNGLRLELPGLGFISFLLTEGFPITKKTFDLTNHKYSEIMNGLNVSTGSWCNCNYNGLTIGVIGQYGKLGNGVSVAGGWNIIDKQNGLELSIIYNRAYYMDGLQITYIYNSSHFMNGVQISMINYMHTGSGLQIGFYNRSKNFKGIQIGYWNVNQKRKLPFINWNFD